MEVVASLSQGRTAAAQCGLFTYKSVPVIFEPLCNYKKFINMSQKFTRLSEIYNTITYVNVIINEMNLAFFIYIHLFIYFSKSVSQ